MRHDRRSFLKSAGAGGSVLALASLPVSRAAADPAAAPAGGYDFDTPYNRIGHDDVKWDGALSGEHMDHIVAGMGIADMDFRAAPSITAALKKAVQYENWGYIDMSQPGRRAWLQSIVDWNRRRHGITVMNLGNMGILTGVHAGLRATMRAFTKPGDKVLLATPIYNGFYGDIHATRTVANESLMKYVNGRYEIDWDDLEAKAAIPGTKISIFCNPQNPVGRNWTREEVTRYAEICLKHNILMLSDEIHCDFMSKGQVYTPVSTLADENLVNNSITYKSVSKSFSLAGQKCAWFFTTNPEVYKGTAFYNQADLNTLGMTAAEAAYAGGEDWLNSVVAYISDNHDYANAYIKANIPLMKVGNVPEGTYLQWIDVSALIDRIGARKMADDANQKASDAAEKLGTDYSGRQSLEAVRKPQTPEDIIQHWMAQNAFVRITTGSSYGLGGANHMRMNIATSRRTLKAALDSMAATLKKLSA